MPEGDTVKKLALSLEKALLLQPLSECYVRGIAASSRWKGQHIKSIETLGKHTLFRFDHEVTLRVHLKMHGMWRDYSPSGAASLPKDKVAVILGVQDRRLVCTDTIDVEVFPSSRRRFHPGLSRLGPDLLGDAPLDFDRIVERARRLSRHESTLSELLMDQRIAAGIGNVYKSELCWLGPWDTPEDPSSAFSPGSQGQHPLCPSHLVTDREMKSYFLRAAELLAANLGPWWRCTRIDRRIHPKPAQELYVYGRGGQDCERCGQTIVRTLTGDQARVTYHCPGCQTIRSA